MSLADALSGRNGSLRLLVAASGTIDQYLLFLSPERFPPKLP